MLATPEDVPVLANFSYGDTPTEKSIQQLLEEILGLGDEFSLNLLEISNRHDIRPLVMRTAITYLELDGILRQGTPYYAGYQLKPLLPIAEIVSKYQGEPARFVQNLFDCARKGSAWFSIAPDEIAETLGQDRSRIVRALEALSDNGWIELKTADLRNRYQRLLSDVDISAVAESLHRRFLNRERQEQIRLDQVISLVEAKRCQTAMLVEHFGEIRAESCGHCSFCVTGRAQPLPPGAHLPQLPGSLSVSDWINLRSVHYDALAEPRQAARFLCGLSSPATSRARITRHPLFGAFEAYPFPDVMTWCEERISGI